MNALDLYRSVRAADVVLEGRVRRVLGELGLTPLEFNALRVLLEHGELRLGPLAGRLLCDDSTLTRAVRRLEARGSVARRVDPADRRAVVVAITDAGRVELGAAETAVADDLARSITGSASRDAARVIDALDHLVETIDDGVAAS